METEHLRPWGMDMDVFIMFLHLSQFASFFVPFGGIVLPFIMWLQFKDKSSEINDHGKCIFNWLISLHIYFLVSGILAFAFLLSGSGVLAFVFFACLVVLAIINLVVVIVAGIKAKERTHWQYPLSLNLFKPSYA